MGGRTDARQSGDFCFHTNINQGAGREETPHLSVSFHSLFSGEITFHPQVLASHSSEAQASELCEARICFRRLTSLTPAAGQE